MNHFWFIAPHVSDCVTPPAPGLYVAGMRPEPRQGWRWHDGHRAGTQEGHVMLVHEQAYEACSANR